MITEIDAKLLEKIADLTGQPVGAFNIRKDSGCEARQSTEHIDISPRADGKAGIDIRIKDGTHGEKCHIPVIISKTGLSEMVYNDFYVGDDCDVEIIAGCGIHNSGCDESRHDGVHTFHIGKNSRVRYAEKHYGEDADGETGRNIMNPQTIVYLGENSSMQMETVQIRGIDSTKRYTKFVCEAGAEAVVTERLLTHGDQKATSEMEIELNGKDARGRVISRSVAQDRLGAAVLSAHGRQRRVLRPCPVRQHHHGRCEDPLHPGDRGELSRRAAHPRGRHRQDRGRPTAQARDAGPVARGGGGHDSEGVPRLTIAKKELADTVCQLFFCEGVSLRTAHTETKGFRMRS